MGLDYLALERSVATLSGGEFGASASRPRSLGAIGVLYVLDEPSAGLHARDNERLIASLHSCETREIALVVEHDEATIRAAVT